MSKPKWWKNRDKTKTFIYALFDPRTPHTLMYVGKSDDPAGRLAVHLSIARHYLDNVQNKYIWMRDLLAKNIRPQFLILEHCAVEVWKERERYWVSKTKAENISCTNMARGGTDWFVHSSHEQRSKIARAAAMRLTPEQRSDRAKRAAITLKNNPQAYALSKARFRETMLAKRARA